MKSVLPKSLCSDEMSINKRLYSAAEISIEENTTLHEVKHVHYFSNYENSIAGLRKYISILLLAVAFFFLNTGIQAQSFNPTEQASGFNVFTEGSRSNSN